MIAVRARQRLLDISPSSLSLFLAQNGGNIKGTNHRKKRFFSNNRGVLHEAAMDVVPRPP
jgi:hypothetical protein